jgi:hypothetical protein
MSLRVLVMAQLFLALLLPLRAGSTLNSTVLAGLFRIA